MRNEICPTVSSDKNDLMACCVFCSKPVIQKARICQYLSNFTLAKPHHSKFGSDFSISYYNTLKVTEWSVPYSVFIMCLIIVSFKKTKKTAQQKTGLERTVVHYISRWCQSGAN